MRFGGQAAFRESSLVQYQTSNLANMNSRNLVGAATAALVAVVASVSASAASYTNADLIIGFRSTDPTYPNSLEINLGNAGNLRINGDNFSNVNLNAVLVGTFGSNWFSNNTLSWGIVAANSVSASTVNGDPFRAIYFSNTTTTIGFTAEDTQPANLTASQRATVATNIGSLATGTNGFTTQADIGGGTVLVPNAESNSWSGKVTTPSAFGAFVSTNLESQLGQAGSFSYVDLYRAYAASGSVTPSYITTFALSSSGLLSASTTSAIPEPSTYAAIVGGLTLAAVAIRRRRKQAA